VSEVVLDASVVLAIVQGEAIHPDIFGLLEGAVMSAVNYAEVRAKRADLKPVPYPRMDDLLDRIEPFTSTQAIISGELRPLTRRAGLSLGDRACLALALELDAEVYTADRAWLDVLPGGRIHLIR
jgi:ribonuclease VapC